MSCWHLNAIAILMIAGVVPAFFLMSILEDQKRGIDKEPSSETIHTGLKVVGVMLTVALIANIGALICCSS